MDDRWRGFRFEVRPDPLHRERYEVEFWPNEMFVVSAATGETRAIERGTLVTVEDQSGLKVIAFRPAEHQYADLQRADYEQKAIEVAGNLVMKT